MENLIAKLYGLFDKGHEVDEQRATEMGLAIAEVVSRRLKDAGEKQGGHLRLSSIGAPKCQQWHNVQGYTPEKLTPQTKIKFLMGDIIEELLLFLVKEAGYTVAGEQETVEVAGVKGHIDCTIDGYLVDVKSASPYGFTKFKEGFTLEEDSFNYIHQLSSYNHALGLEGQSAYWLAMDKSSGELALRELDELEMVHDIEGAVEDVKGAVQEPVCPDKVEPVPVGKSGNMKLGPKCRYCDYKWDCRPDMREFLYKQGSSFLTTVVSTPKVDERLRDGTIIKYVKEDK